MRSLLAYAAVVVASVGAAAWSANVAIDASERSTRMEVRRLAYDFAQKTRDASVAGCYRTRDDRLDAVRGWQTALEARHRTARNRDVNERERLSAAAAAEVYKQVIRGYRSRIVDCAQAFPAPVQP